MKFLKYLFNKIVYNNTKKPSCYIHVDSPKSLQEYRQLQYNNWCKVKKVYNGSYLPINPDKLTIDGKKGWKEITSSKDKTGLHRKFLRKSSNQIVDYHYKNVKNRKKLIDEHYHWKNTNIKNGYYDRYGKQCEKNSKESHLAPLDRNYNYK